MPESDLALLSEAAKEAGRIARRFWREDPETWDKGGSAGPVTEADLAVDRMLHAELRRERPDYGWLSEETEDDHGRLLARRVFVIDPIDGTRSFVAGERTWAHSLAIVEDGRPVTAVVYLPVRDKFYAATAEGPATLNGQPVGASVRDALDGATVLAARPNLDPEHWGGRPPNVARHFRSSLAYRLSLVGEGRFDAMLTLRRAWEWDIAAGALIAERAGAKVTDRRGKPLRFNGRERLVDGVVAGAPSVHRGFVERLA
ncbi:MAG: 3'(2'),5'-bisphosphate nucleotidase CysQ [Pseudomonadota bacterium]